MICALLAPLQGAAVSSNWLKGLSLSADGDLNLKLCSQHPPVSQMSGTVITCALPRFQYRYTIWRYARKMRGRCFGKWCRLCPILTWSLTIPFAYDSCELQGDSHFPLYGDRLH